MAQKGRTEAVLGIHQRSGQPHRRAGSGSAAPEADGTRRRFGDSRAQTLVQTRSRRPRLMRKQGDGVLVYFGYPRAHEDDAERAVRAGLRLIDAVGRLDIKSAKLQARVGIATGLMVVGDLIERVRFAKTHRWRKVDSNHRSPCKIGHPAK